MGGVGIGAGLDGATRLADAKKRVGKAEKLQEAELEKLRSAELKTSVVIDGYGSYQEAVRERTLVPFVHWLAILPPGVRNLPEGIPPIPRVPGLPVGQQGSNSRSETGYFGPRPPAGDPPHPYHFQVFALDVPLSLPPGFNRHVLIEAMRGHVLAHGELVGTFAK